MMTDDSHDPWNQNAFRAPKALSSDDHTNDYPAVYSGGNDSVMGGGVGTFSSPASGFDSLRINDSPAPSSPAKAGPRGSAPPGSPGADAAVDFQCSLTDPVKEGDGMSAYITYKVNTRTTLPQYQWGSFSSKHRYKDFEWLHQTLSEKFPACIIPPMPEKAVMGRFEPQFIELRRQGLERFLNRVVSHPALQTSSDVQAFLEASEGDAFNNAKKASAAATAAEAKKKSGGGIGGWFSRKKQSVFKGNPEPVDPFFEEQKQYMDGLEVQIENMRKFTDKLIKQRQGLAVSYSEFALACTLLGNCETDQYLNDAFNLVGENSEKIAVLHNEEADAEISDFEEILKDYANLIIAYRVVVKNKATAAADLQLARSELESKKSAYQKVAGQGGKESKAAALAKEITDAEEDVEVARKEYEKICASIESELKRFHLTKITEFKQMLLNFVKMQMDYADRVHQAWASLQVQLDNVQAGF